MKKITAIILLICMVFGSVITGAEKVMTDSADYSKELFVFEYLGALRGQSGEIDVTKEMSRGEFVNMLAKALSLPVGDGSKIYYDVDKESLYFDSVAYFTEKGILSIGDDREFRPNDSILYSEALKILLSLAGYEEYVSANGGYPLGYVMTAKRFGVDMPKANEDAMLCGEAMHLMLDVMTMGVYDLRLVGEDLRHYAVNSTDTLLAINKDLVIGRGTVETTPAFSMTSNTSTDGTVFIDGIEYEVYDKLNVTGLEGSYVEFIYEDTDSVDKLVYAEIISNKKDVYITSEQYIDFSPNSFTLTYYDDLESGKKASISLSKSWNVVFNGRSYGGSLSEAFKGFTSGERKGTIEIKRDYNSENAVLIIKSYRRYILRSYDLTTNTLYNKFNSTDSVDLGTYNAVIMRKATGEKVLKEELVPETALLIAEAEGKEFLDILVPDREVSATVTYIDTAKKSIRTNDETFKLDAMEWIRIKDVLEIGYTYTLFIDAFGEVAYMNLTKTADSIMLGYIAASSVTNMFGTPEVTVKMLTQAGEVQILKFAERINIDGILYNGDKMVNALYAIPETDTISGMSLSEASSQSGNIRIKKQLVRYRTNSRGEINYIDTYNVNYNGGETKETSLTKYQKRFELLEYREATAKRFDRDVLYNSSTTKVFNVPWTDDDGYMIKGLDTWKTVGEIEYQVDNQGNKKKENDRMYSIGGSFTDYKYYNIDVYEYDSNNPYADVIVNHDDFIGGGLYAQVREIYQAVDEEGNVGHGVKLIGSKGEGTYFAELDADVEGLNVGDIIYGTTQGEYLYNTYKIFDCQTRSFVNSSSSVEYWYKGNRTATTDEYRQQNQFSKGTVTRMQSNCVFWKYDMQDSTTEYDEAADLSLIKFTVYDRNGKGEPYVEAGTADRIKEFSVAGDDCSYVVCLSDLNRTIYAFVFNGR